VGVATLVKEKRKRYDKRKRGELKGKEYEKEKEEKYENIGK
jgi:hypothetical protein